jgi:hypothetical protein
LQYKKECSPRTETDEGRQTDCNDEQKERAAASIMVNLESDSNVNDKRDLQSSKHFSPMTSTEAGTQMNCNDRQSESVIFSSRVSFELGSNANSESDLHLEKHCSEMISTDEGMQIDRNGREGDSGFKSITRNFEPNSKAIYRIVFLKSAAETLISVIARGITIAVSPSISGVETEITEISNRTP